MPYSMSSFLAFLLPCTSASSNSAHTDPLCTMEGFAEFGSSISILIIHIVVIMVADVCLPPCLYVSLQSLKPPKHTCEKLAVLRIPFPSVYTLL